MGERRGGWGPVTWTRVSSDWKLDQPGFCLLYATPGDHAEFRPEPPTLAVTWSVACSREPKFRVFPAFSWGWGRRGSLGAPGLRGERLRQHVGEDSPRSDSGDGASRVPRDLGAPHGPTREGPLCPRMR